MVHKLCPAAPHLLAALFNCLVILPNYLSKCNALQLLRYNTTLNAFDKSEFLLVGFIYSITRPQQAKLKCMLRLARPQWRPVGEAGRWHMPRQGICPWVPAEEGAPKEGAAIFGDTKYTKNL